MKLCRKPRVGLVAYALIRTVIHIDEERFPVGRDGVIIDSVAVILGRDVAVLSQFSILQEAHRLVVTTMTIFQFLHLCSSSQSQNLVSHADTIDRLALLHEFLDVSDGLRA